MSFGIEESEDVIRFIGELAGAIDAAKADGKLDIFDAVKALSLGPSAMAAVKGAGSIRDELGDLSGEEKDKLIGDLKEAIFKLVGALT